MDIDLMQDENNGLIIVLDREATEQIIELTKGFISSGTLVHRPETKNTAEDFFDNLENQMVTDEAINYAESYIVSSVDYVLAGLIADVESSDETIENFAFPVPADVDGMLTWFNSLYNYSYRNKLKTADVGVVGGNDAFENRSEIQEILAEIVNLLSAILVAGDVAF